MLQCQRGIPPLQYAAPVSKYLLTYIATEQQELAFHMWTTWICQKAVFYVTTLLVAKIKQRVDCPG